MHKFLSIHFQWDQFKKNWKTEAVSGFILFLVALPLSIGISLASGAPPTAGILAAIGGGLLGSLIGTGHVMINGPAAGLIVVVLTSIQTLGQGNAQSGFRLTLAAIVMAGLIQIGLGVLRFGALGILAPVQVIHGMLASIGITVMTKQIYVLCGRKAAGLETLEQIVHLPEAIANANGVILTIGLITLALIIFLNKSKSKLTKLIPAPLAAVFLGIAFDKAFDLEHPHLVELFAHPISQVSDAFLLHVPSKLTEGIIHPDWSLLSSGLFWKMTLMICFVASIESVLSACAVDKIDPIGRRTQLNGELVSKGVCNTFLGIMGGLPIITEMVRSSINVGNGAQTKWPNMFHGLLILLFVVLFPGVLNLIPLTSFAAILIVVGFRLAHPKQLLHAYEIGWEQLLYFLFTLLVSLKTDLLIGVFSGIILKLIITWVRSRTFTGSFRLLYEKKLEGETYVISVSGPVVFTNLLKLKSLITQAQSEANNIRLDLRHSLLVDHTAQDFLESEKKYLKSNGKELKIEMSERHQQVGHHALSAQVLKKDE
ncbi:SulP family inorganic anion transporter [bacterium]|nr:SulP family inorganic anion transporter [bacterium]